MQSSVHPLAASDCHTMSCTGVWNTTAPFGLERFVCVHFQHWTFSGTTDTGRFVVLDVVAPYVASIMDELYKRRFPLKSALPMEAFDGNDYASMAANNSSALNVRPIATDEGAHILSLHSYGIAIDINPWHNPMILYPGLDKEEVYPKGALCQRYPVKRGMCETITSLFSRYGFTQWGGNWISLHDYHHFQVPRIIGERLASLSYSEGKDFFARWVDGNSSI